MKKTITAWVEEYLEHRRSLGFALRIEGGQLRNFAQYADRIGHTGALTRELVYQWAKLPSKADRLYTARRVEVARGFARYHAIFNHQTEIPTNIFGPAHRRTPPYIYTTEEIKQLIRAARRLHGDLRAHTYATLFGLIACTGLRISEALRLRIDEVDLNEGVITVVASKNHITRLVPLHDSAKNRLRAYARRRNALFSQAECFFVSHQGTRLPYSTVRTNFAKLRPILSGNQRAPRIHDLRHTFACRVLRNYQLRGDRAGNELTVLSRYLGHNQVSDTYWYLTGIPELLAEAASRFKP